MDSDPGFGTFLILSNFCLFFQLWQHLATAGAPLACLFFDSAKGWASHWAMAGWLASPGGGGAWTCRISCLFSVCFFEIRVDNNATPHRAAPTSMQNVEETHAAKPRGPSRMNDHSRPKGVRSDATLQWRAPRHHWGARHPQILGRRPNPDPKSSHADPFTGNAFSAWAGL